MSLLLDRQIAAARAAIENRTIVRAFADVRVDLGELVKLAETRGAPRFKSGKTLRARLTSNRLDSHGTIIDPRGADVERFLRNPVVLWQHGLDAAGNLPIGTVNSLDMRSEAIDGTIEFDDGTPLGKQIMGLFQRRILRGFSIGFLPNMVDVAAVTDGEGTREVPVFRKWELLELSAVCIPSNQDCCVLEDAAKEAA